MRIWRGLFLAIALFVLGGTTAQAFDGAQQPIERQTVAALTVDTAAPATTLDAPHTGEDHTLPMLYTGIAAIAGLGIALVMFLYRWVTGNVHTPTAEEYQAAQQAIFGGHH